MLPYMGTGEISCLRVTGISRGNEVSAQSFIKKKKKGAFVQQEARGMDQKMTKLQETEIKQKQKVSFHRRRRSQEESAGTCAVTCAA